MSKKYSDDDRGEALARLDANGGNLLRTSEETGIPRNTLRAWVEGFGVNEEVSKTRHQKRKQLASMFQDEAEDAIKAASRKRSQASYSQLMMAAGIAIDKAQRLDEADSLPRELVQEFLHDLEDIAANITNEEDREKIAALIERFGDADSAED